jgi:hypothetical protein
MVDEFRVGKLGQFSNNRSIELKAMTKLTAEKGLILLGWSGAPSETRTPDPLIKSQLLYQLS